MRTIGKRALSGVAVAGTLALGFGFGSAWGRTKADATIVGLFGVGGVISESGTLWQYMPDDKKWMTIDEAFQRDGRETHILPLPVAARDIKFMESWGFIVARDGTVWQYDLEGNKWQNVGTP